MAQITSKTIISTKNKNKILLTIRMIRLEITKSSVDKKINRIHLSPRCFSAQRSEEVDGPVSQTRNYESLEHKQEIEQNTRSIRAKHRKRTRTLQLSLAKWKSVQGRDRTRKGGGDCPHSTPSCVCARVASCWSSWKMFFLRWWATDERPHMMDI